MDVRTKISDQVFSGQLQNTHRLPTGISFPVTKHVPGELLLRRSGSKCGSSLSLVFRNAVQTLPRTDQTYDWPLNCFSPEAPGPPSPDQDQPVGAPERTGEKDDPAAAEDRSPGSWRRLEAKLRENEEEFVLVIKGMPRESDVLVEGSSPAAKRTRIIFVTESD